MKEFLYDYGKRLWYARLYGARPTLWTQIYLYVWMKFNPLRGLP